MATLKPSVINGGGNTAPLVLKNGDNGYKEGLRIIMSKNWSDIVLGGSGLTETEGISDNSWFLGNNNGNFYITRGGSTDPASGHAQLKCVDNYWTFTGNISVPTITATTINASGSSNRINFRHIDGQQCTSADYDLYLQYHQSGYKTYFNGNTYYIKGGYYNGTSENSYHVVGTNDAASPGNALLISGYNRADNSTGSTWLFYDALGGTDSPWGIKHNQPDNFIEYYGAGNRRFYIDLNNGNIYKGAKRYALAEEILSYNFSGTDFVSGNSGNGTHDANDMMNGHYYYYTNGPSTTLGVLSTDGAIYSQAYDTNWRAQIAQDYRTGRLAVRGKNNGAWTNWVRVLDAYDGNITTGDSFNSFMTQGEYSYDSGATGGPVSSSWGKVIVKVSDGTTHNNSSNWIWQIALQTENYNIYRRGKTNNGGWSSWRRLAYADEIPSVPSINYTSGTLTIN